MNMKAVSCTKYGAPDVLQRVELPVPTPKSGEVLVRILNTTVTAADLMMRTGLPVIGRLYLGIRRPNKPVFGFDFAGEVIGLGPDVTAFKVGQRVFGGTTELGCYAEYACIKADDVILEIPEGISYEQAAPVAASAITVWNFLKGQANLASRSEGADLRGIRWIGNLCRANRQGARCRSHGGLQHCQCRVGQGPRGGFCGRLYPGKFRESRSAI
ncbi:MAG: alcohol dehydrogenase catalytic domain-containing protein [Bacteroidetes bacterium]|nr:alcohol dehydrogenase catalytic domain-containing protein [Bacteroidota bacterium]